MLSTSTYDPKVNSPSMKHHSLRLNQLIRAPFIGWVLCGLFLLLFLWWLLPLLHSNVYHLPPPYHPHVPPPPFSDQLGTDALPTQSHELNAGLWSTRASEVRQAFIHAYKGYMDYAFPADELRPLSNDGINNFVAWGVSVYDALDTMWIMDLHDYFYEGVKFVSTVHFTETSRYAPFFETVIRHLGGLLSAYALSQEPRLLAKADELGSALLPVFNTPSGFPDHSVNPKSGSHSGGWAHHAIWSESMSCQLEYKYLAHVTGKPEYFQKVDHLMDLMAAVNLTDAGFPVMWDKESGKPQDDRFAVGALADSGYEYFLKQWLMTSRTETKLRDLYIQSANLIVEKLLFLTPNRQILYVTDTHSGTPTHIFEHLSCFTSGMLALGVHTLHSELTAREKEVHLWAAKGLAQSCVLMYFDQEGGLGPDEVVMDAYPNWRDGRWLSHFEKWEQDGRIGYPPGLNIVQPEKDDSKREYKGKSRTYLLRPETVESLFILWRTTGEEKWRDMGWKIFQAIEQHSKTASGYASISDVYPASPIQMDEMPSYFLAETLKYFYLLFMDQEIIPLDKFVFNTEAHPLPVFEWMKFEKSEYHIPV